MRFLPPTAPTLRHDGLKVYVYKIDIAIYCYLFAVLSDTSFVCLCVFVQKIKQLLCKFITIIYVANSNRIL